VQKIFIYYFLLINYNNILGVEITSDGELKLVDKDIIEK
jgi:hypothetical protein